MLCISSDSETRHKIGFVAMVIGVLMSCLPAVPFGALYTKFIEIDKIRALKRNKSNFDSFRTLSDAARAELLL